MSKKQKTPKPTATAQKVAPPAVPAVTENPMNGVVRALLLLFAFSLPFLYDLAVPEVSGDIRWTATHVVAGLGAVLLLLGGWKMAPARLVLRLPALGWLAVGLVIWALVSMVDAIDWIRGIVLIKAMVSQLLLVLLAALVWTPRFGRQLTWALVLPIGFVGMLGIGQFWGLSDASFKAVLPVWLSWAWPSSGGMWDVLLGYYQQSAIPGSSFANKNLAASYVTMILPLGVYLLATTKSLPRQVLLSGVMALALIFLLYTRTRSSWLALVVGTLLLVGCALLVPAWRHALLRHARVRQLGWLLPAVLLVMSQWNVTSPLNGHGITDKPGDQIAKIAEGKWDEVGGRIAYNLNSVLITRDHWLNGVGLGNFYGIYPAYHNAWVETPTNSYSVMARPQRTHTDLMQAFVEMGVPGGLLYAGLLVCVLVYVGWLGTRKAAEKLALLGSKYTLWPLFAGAALVNISVNATMDFPMQLPTAPAVVALLMGGVVWWYGQVFGERAYTLRLPAMPYGKVGVSGVLAVLLVANVWAIQDSWYYREANKVLKWGMIRVMSNVMDEETVRVLEEADAIYPYDPRIKEHLGVVYANYSGKTPMPTELRIEKLEATVRADPWGANHLINLMGQYLTQAEQARVANQPEVTAKALARIDELLPNMQKSAGFSEYYWGVAGLIQLTKGNAAAALPLLERSLAINPNYEPAKQGLLQVGLRLGKLKVSGTEVVVVQEPGR